MQRYEKKGNSSSNKGASNVEEAKNQVSEGP
jgi:hypothetical protein